MVSRSSSIQSKSLASNRRLLQLFYLLFSGQTEHRYKDGSVEVHYQNGSIRITNPNWTDDSKEEWRLPDGTNIKIKNNETKILTFANGQREIHTTNHKRREYPDGTVKVRMKLRRSPLELILIPISSSHTKTEASRLATPTVA
jgi:T-complex protein 10 C-terminus